MSVPYLGEIRAVGFNFAPRGWAFCNGQTLSIAQYDALFTLIGTTYGGDGNNTFALPNLCSRVGVGSQAGAAGPGLSSYTLGQTGGQEAVTLAANQMPVHQHPFSASLAATTGGTTSNEPVGHRPGGSSPFYNNTSSADASLAGAAVTGTTTATGGNMAHTNIQPVLALNFIIATEGIFPPQM